MQDAPGTGRIGTQAATATALAPTTFPGDACVLNDSCALRIRIQNDSGGDLVLTGWTAVPAPLTVDGPNNDCSNAELGDGLSILAGSGQSITLAPGTAEYDLPGALHVSDLPDECQGVTFSIAAINGLDLRVQTP